VGGAAAHVRVTAAGAATAGEAAATARGARAGRAQLEQRDHVGRGEEGIGDRLAGRGGDRGDEAAVGLGHEQRAGGDLLIAETGNEVVAALSLDTGAGVADPFRRTADVVDLLAYRARGLKAS